MRGDEWNGRKAEGPEPEGMAAAPVAVESTDAFGSPDPVDDSSITPV